MKRRSSASLLVLAPLLAGCGIATQSGSGNVITREVSVSDFDRVAVNNGFHVAVTQADTFGVVIRVDDNLADKVEVENRDGTLYVGLKAGVLTGLRSTTLEADVTMPVLSGLEAAGGSHVGLEAFTGQGKLPFEVSGGSHLDGSIEAGDTTFDLSGGSHATLTGTAGNITVAASGGSHANLGDLEAANANVAASGGSHITVNASGTLTAEASGGSHVTYLGSPTLDTIDADVSSQVSAGD